MQEFTYEKLLHHLLELTSDELAAPVKIIALDQFTAHEIIKADGGVILNNCEFFVPDHNIYNVKTPFVYGTSSRSLEEIETANTDVETTTKKVVSKGSPVICLTVNRCLRL